MVTIPVKVPDRLAGRLLPLQDRLVEIIELGLRQIEEETGQPEASLPAAKLQVWEALKSTGIVTLPGTTARPQSRTRRTPICAGGSPASELIIQERGTL
jgi:hypothetical protein